MQAVDEISQGLCQPHNQLPYFLAIFRAAQQTLLLADAWEALSGHYSTVTDFARLRGLSTSVPRAQAV